MIKHSVLCFSSKLNCIVGFEKEIEEKKKQNQDASEEKCDKKKFFALAKYDHHTALGDNQQPSEQIYSTNWASLPVLSFLTSQGQDPFTIRMAPTLTKLLEQSSIVDHDEIIRACKESYGKTNDVLIKHIELVALLKLDQLSKAQDLLGQEDGNLKQQAAFERAYVLYKTGNLREAIEVAAAFGSAKPEHRGIKHVEAQAVGVSEAY